MANKKKSPCGAATPTGARGESLNEHFTPEFDDCQAERIFNRDLSWIIVGCIAILILCVMGVI